MDEIRIRELPQKDNSISLSDLVILEDSDGTKTVEATAFKSLVQQSIFYDNIEAMKSATLKEGDIVKTLGYWEKGDGGGAYYQIVYAPTDLDDGINVHYLHTSDTLRAHYIMGEYALNSMQFGTRGNGVNDDYSKLQKAINEGSRVTFVKRTYRITGSLEVPSDTIIDLNGATILCNSTAAFTIGLDKEAKNIVIKNGRIIALNGIEVHSYASEVDIHDCIITGGPNLAMSTGILISGATHVKVSNNKIGCADYETRYGIMLSNGPRNSDGGGSYESLTDSDVAVQRSDMGAGTSNQNIQITNNDIYASIAGISASGAYTDKNISVDNAVIEGYGDRTGKDIYGVLLSSNVNGFAAHSIKVKNTNCAICVTGITSSISSFNDILVDDSDLMYNLASMDSTVYIGPMQKFNGNYSGTAYVFDRVTSKMVLQGEIDATVGGSIKGYYKTSLTGETFDTANPVGKKKISVTSIGALNKADNTNAIPPFKNVSLNLEFSGSVNTLTFPSLSGQVVALYSDAASCKLVPSTSIKTDGEITLSRYEPVLLRNTSGIWYMVQFGGSGDSSGSGTGGLAGSESLVIKTNGNLMAEYNGSARREIDLTPNAIGAAGIAHTHTANEISGIPTVPTSMKNPFNLVIRVNGGVTEGTDQFTYDGSKTVEANIIASSGGGGGIDPSVLEKYGLKNNFVGTGSFSVNRAISTQVGTNSVALGTSNRATGDSSIAIGYNNTSNGKGSVAAGSGCTASADATHAEGVGTNASGVAAHAEGNGTAAANNGAHAEGEGTIAMGANQHVEGRYNVQDNDGRYIHIAGAGSNASNRKNVYTLDWNGNAVYAGTVSVATPTSNAHAATKQYVDAQHQALSAIVNDNKDKIDNLITGLGANLLAAGGTVTDWDEVYQNGFVIATGRASNGPETVEYTDILAGICISQVNRAGDDADTALIIAIPISRNIADSEDENENVTLQAYIRQKNDGQWDPWYLMNIATGKQDHNISGDPSDSNS